MHTIALEEVVVGDLVLLEMGDEIPADGRVVKATELYVDQSLMTGESEPVRKTVRSRQSTSQRPSEAPEQPGCLYRGTQVVDGAGQMLVTEVGDETYLGQIARRLSSSDERASESGPKRARPTSRRRRARSAIQRKLTIDKNLTPLQLKLKHLAELISKVGYIAAILIFLAQLVRGILVGEVFVPRDSAQAVNVFGELLGYFVTMVIIIVVAVPEGLPMSVTVSLALAMRKMTRANSPGPPARGLRNDRLGHGHLLRQDRHAHAEQDARRAGVLDDRSSTATTRLAVRDDSAESLAVILNAAVNSTANLEEKDGKLVTSATPPKGALLHWLREGNVDYRKLRQRVRAALSDSFLVGTQADDDRDSPWTELADRAGQGSAGMDPRALPGIPGRRRHAPAVDRGEADRDSRPARRRRPSGDAHPGLRLCRAAAGDARPTRTPCTNGANRWNSNLVYTGFVAIRDPLRDDVKEAVAECRQAGIEVKMVTGDNVETARAIGYEIGLVDSPRRRSTRRTRPCSPVRVSTS